MPTRMVTPTSATTPAYPAPAELSYVAGILGVVNGLALVLSARLIVLVAVAGAIGLTYLALGRSDQWNVLILLGTYLVGCVVPAVWLAAYGK